MLKAKEDQKLKPRQGPRIKSYGVLNTNLVFSSSEINLCPAAPAVAENVNKIVFPFLYANSCLKIKITGQSEKERDSCYRGMHFGRQNVYLDKEQCQRGDLNLNLSKARTVP